MKFAFNARTDLARIRRKVFPIELALINMLTRLAGPVLPDFVRSAVFLNCRRVKDSSMSEKIVYSDLGLLEYSLPISEIPPEVNDAWKAWLGSYVGCSSPECHELLKGRFQDRSPQLADLARCVLKHKPCSLFVYVGTPFFRLQNAHERERFISLPPEVDLQAVKRGLEPFEFQSHQLLVELFARFGGICQQSPCGEAGFAGRRFRGELMFKSAATDFEAGLECCTDAEVRERRRNFARWRSGVQVANGGDNEYWHIGSDGSICSHECGISEIGGVFDSLTDFIDELIKASSEGCLFNGLYSGLWGRSD